MRLKRSEDAFGQAMLDHLDGRPAYEIVERDDGHFGIGAGPKLYFSEYDAWRQVERDAMKYVTGRVLDIGCGAGRFMLWLRDRGHEVVGIDNSPGAIETCRRRGLENVHVTSIARIPNQLGVFDTILLLGGNLGLLGEPDRARRALSRLSRLSSAGARLLGASRDRTTSDDPYELAQMARNAELGRLSGQSRIRIRYRTFATPFFDFFRIAPHELENMVRGTGWVVADTIDRKEGIYIAVLDKS